MRVVFDTNVLIDGFQDDFNAASRLIDAVSDGELEALATHPIRQEYRLITNRLMAKGAFEERVDRFLSMIDNVRPANPDEQVVIDDREDYKFIQAAIGGQAEYIITSDRHLLDIGEVGSVKMLTPVEALAKLEDENDGGGAWQQFIHGLGIGS